MPFYSYYCEQCKSEQEEMFTMASKPDAITCKTCGGSAKSQLSPVGFQVNGANAANRYSGESNFKWYGVPGTEED